MSSPADDQVTLELFIEEPPASPNTSRRRGANEGGSALTTPARPSKAPALARTISLPEGFSMGDVNMRGTEKSVKERTGKDLPRGILPAKAVLKFEKKYEGSKRNAGSVVLMLAKGEDKSVISVCFYTAPWQIGKKLVEAIDQVAKRKGFEGSMKKRHCDSSGSASTRAAWRKTPTTSRRWAGLQRRTRATAPRTSSTW